MKKKKKRAQICAEKKERKKESRRQTGQLCPVKCNWSLIKKGKSHAQGRSAKSNYTGALSVSIFLSHTLHRHRSSFLLQHLRDICTCLLLHAQEHFKRPTQHKRDWESIRAQPRRSTFLYKRTGARRIICRILVWPFVQNRLWIQSDDVSFYTLCIFLPDVLSFLMGPLES